MKKLMIALVALFTLTGPASAMSYEQAKDEALFLTDKMAYELNLTDDQYEAAYEINLDYLMSIDNYDDLYGSYWQQRNLDLSYIMLDWQYNMFCDDLYFYRPLYWDGGYWHFRIYARYPHRSYFFFGRPDFYGSYRGGHSWRMNGGRSWYHGRDFGGREIGMRDAFNQGNFGRGRSYGNQGMQTAQNNRTFGNMSQNNRYRNFSNRNGMISRQSSTRTTVNRGTNRTFSGNRSYGNRSESTTPSRTFSPRSSNSNQNFGSRSAGVSSSSRSFGGNDFRSSRSTIGSFGGTRSGGSSSSHGSGSNGNAGGGHFGGHR